MLTACFRFSASFRLMDRPQRCQKTTAARASTTPATAPPAMAAMGRLSPDLTVAAAAGVSADEGVGELLFASTVVV